MLKRIMKKKCLLLTAAILAAMTVPAYAAEKKPEDGKAIKTGAVVVTASRTEQEVKETPSSVEVITREDIDKMARSLCAKRCSLQSVWTQRRRVWWEIKFPFAAHRQIKH